MIPFSPPFIDKDVINEVKNTLISGWITSGPKVKSLEDEISKEVGVSNVLCLNSATSGLMLALKWFGVSAGDEVIIPAYTYCATALAIYHIGAFPVMVDIKDDFNIDPELILRAITHKTKAIIPVDIAGWPADVDEILKIVKKEEIVRKFKPNSIEQNKLGRILVVSDSAHSFGAIYKGRKVGRNTDLTIFSFHAVKNITTAEGGAICINLPDQFDNSQVLYTMKLMSLNGQTKDAYAKTLGGGWKYDIILPGYKMNMPDVCASIGLSQIKKYTSCLLPKREKIALMYNDYFSKYDWAEIPPLKENQSETSYHIYALRIKGIDEFTRDMIIDEITKTEVSVNVHFIPLPMLTFFKNLGYNIENFPRSYKNYASEISLPIYPQLTFKQVKVIIKAVVRSYNTVVKKW